MAFFFFMLLSGYAWMGLRGDVSLSSFVAGVVGGMIVWRILGSRSSRRFAFGRALRLAVAGLRVLALFLWELVVANFDQLQIVLAPRLRVRPHWVHFDTELRSPVLRALLGVMISLTPGSLVCDEFERDDGSVCLWIHILDCDDPAPVVARIGRRLEEPLRALEEL